MVVSGCDDEMVARVLKTTSGPFRLRAWALLGGHSASLRASTTQQQLTRPALRSGLHLFLARLQPRSATHTAVAAAAAAGESARPPHSSRSKTSPSLGRTALPAPSPSQTPHDTSPPNPSCARASCLTPNLPPRAHRVPQTGCARRRHEYAFDPTPGR